MYAVSYSNCLQISFLGNVLFTSYFDICKNIFACLFSVLNIISLSHHEQYFEVTFREILLPSSGNVNHNVAHI